MGTHHHNKKAGGLDMTELVIAAAAIILFWIGLKFGMKSAGGLFPDDKNQPGFAILSLAAGIVSGFIASGVFTGLYLGIATFLKKRNKNKQ